MSQNDIYKEIYKEEAYELLGELETSLLELEDQPDDYDLISRVFRAMHTIKGSGNMFGFENIVRFTHDIETVYDMVRDGKIKVTRKLIDLTLAARDQIRLMLQEAEDESSDNEEREKILSELKEILPKNVERKEPLVTTSVIPSAAEDKKSGEETYRICFKPKENIFMNGTNPLCLLDELCSLGISECIAFTNDVPELERYNSELCYTYWNIILTTDKGMDAIKDVFIFSEDDCELKIDLVDDEKEAEDPYKKVGQIFIEKGEISSVQLHQALEQQQQQQQRIGELLVSSGAVSGNQLAAALVEQEHVKDVRSKRKQEEGGASVRVPSEKLDKLVDLVGELVITQARLSQTAAGKRDTLLTSIAEELERLTVELRDNTLNIRMLQIGTSFGKFKRLVRDLSKELGKEIELITEGAETELDKTVIEKLNDPLIHLIRNSIDHGIELPETRMSSGKPKIGTVHLSAVHSGANVLIKIKDDGAGLDKDLIYAKAVEKGIISYGTELPEKDIFALIFAPGFSTAKIVTNVSGRGVGMDVVKKSIESLGGFIDIESEKKKGTTITLRLPLTLAIIEGLLVNIGEEFYVLPLSAVEECVELTRQDIENAHGRHIVNVRGEIVPYISLKEYFDIKSKQVSIEQVVVTKMNELRVGFVVDKVIGEHQTVIKNLGKAYKDVKGISGATILGNGDVALILDLPELIREAEDEEIKLAV